MMGKRSVNSFVFVKCSMLKTIVGQALWVPILVEQIWMTVDIEEVIMTQSLVKQRAPVEFFLPFLCRRHGFRLDAAFAEAACTRNEPF